jgi:MFS family permease
MFITFRFFSGAGSWMSLAAAALLMNELAPAHVRGACVDVNGSMFLLGCVISTWTGFGFYWWTDGGSNTWRPPFAIQIFWGLCAVAPLPFLPESPRFLCMKGRYSEAKKVLIKLHADPRDNTHELATKEFYQIQKQIELDLSYGNTWAYIIKKPSYRKRAYLALGTTLFTQCSGALVINSRAAVAISKK